MAITAITCNEKGWMEADGPSILCACRLHGNLPYKSANASKLLQTPYHASNPPSEQSTTVYGRVRVASLRVLFLYYLSLSGHARSKLTAQRVLAHLIVSVPAELMPLLHDCLQIWIEDLKESGAALVVFAALVWLYIWFQSHRFVEWQLPQLAPFS